MKTTLDLAHFKLQEKFPLRHIRICQPKSRVILSVWSGCAQPFTVMFLLSFLMAETNI